MKKKKKYLIIILYTQDKPESANKDQFKLIEGDIIVLATDGLWDNLHEMSLLNNISELKVIIYTKIDNFFFYKIFSLRYK